MVPVLSLEEKLNIERLIQKRFDTQRREHKLKNRISEIKDEITGCKTQTHELAKEIAKTINTALEHQKPIVGPNRFALKLDGSIIIITTNPAGGESDYAVIEQFELLEDQYETV